MLTELLLATLQSNAIQGPMAGNGSVVAVEQRLSVGQSAANATYTAIQQSVGIGPAAIPGNGTVDGFPSLGFGPEALGDGPPVLFALDPSIAVGPASINASGYRFLDGQGGTVTVLVDGLPVTVSNATAGSADLGVPGSADAFGNPVGELDLSLSTADGSTVATDALVSGPSLYLVGVPKVGGELTIDFRIGAICSGPAGCLRAFGYAALPPLPFGIPLPGFVGGLRILPDGELPVVSVFGPVDRFVAPLPDNPNLVGVTLWFQAGLLDGAVLYPAYFTDVLEVVLQ